MICGLISTITKTPVPPDVFDDNKLGEFVDNLSD